ncbi:hypothetical protein CASFOL_029991 [Castilleja foliolosa]|uniref:COP1-interacting protein 7 n=1 Tax=Castilleja foliolosa TaxID=1961234 RepID=A0ABD3CA49_9LAMI
MKPSTRLSSAVFQLTPTRTRCDLIIIANGKKEKIASGLLNPFIAHLKTAQDQIAKGGYSISLEPDTDAAWFTKATLERFVRFVSTPEILERVCTIQTEILQIEEAIIMQSSNDIGQRIVEDRQDKPLGGCEENKSVCNANEEKAIVLYKPEATVPEVNGSCLQEGNSKVQLLKVLETRKTVLLKEQGMAFARAAAAGFSIDVIEPLSSFAEFFGAFRLMEACSRFVDLWKSKQETGEWVDIEASETLLTQSDFSIMNASGDFLSATNNKHDESNHDLAPEDNGKSGSSYSADNPTPNGQQSYFQGQFPHIMFPPWPMNAPPGAQPVFQAYPVQGMPCPYYPTYTTNGPFFSPPQHPLEHSQSNVSHQSVQKMQSLDGKDSNTKSNKKQSGKVVIQNINYVTSKENESGSTDSDLEIDAEDDDHDAIHSNIKENGSRGIDDGNWQVFQNCLLRGSKEDVHASNEGMFAMEKNDVRKRQANISSLDELALNARETREFCDETYNQYPETNGQKVLSRSTHEDFVIGSQQNQTIFRNSSDPLMMDNFNSATCKTDGKSVYAMSDETFIVPFRSVSIDEAGRQAGRNVIDVDSEIPLSDKKLDSEGDRNKAYYEPDDLSMMPERGSENRLVKHDPALDYEIQVSVERSQEKGGRGVTEVQGGLKKTEKQRTGGPIKKGRPSKMSPPEDARARAEKLRSYKADLQKLKKEKDEAEAKRIEALKLERKKRIVARGGPTSGKPAAPSPQTKQLPAKFSPISKSKFSDAEPGSSSPLQRSKIRTSLGSREPLKASKGTKLFGASHLAGNRLTRSSSSLSETKRESNGGRIPDSKASVSQIRRLSEPKRVVSKPGLSERNKISAIINLDKSKAATLPELKIKTSKSHICTVESDADENTIVEKTVVMLEYEEPSLSNFQDSEGKLEIMYDDRGKGKKSDVISEFAPSHASSSSMDMDAVDREPVIRHLQTKFDSNEVSAAYPEKNTPNFANISTAEKPYHDVSVQDHHVPYGKTLNMDKNSVTSDKKTLAKESSRGLKRLLKLGKKNHSSSNLSFSSNCTSVDVTEHDDNATHTASTSEVQTIKNLISQDEASTDGKASRKISHHFSLFSPFRSKTNEKKGAS